MNLDFQNLYKNIDKIINGPVIDLSQLELHPWSIVMTRLLLIERMENSDKKLILPKDSQTKSYLKRMRFDKILSELGYEEEKNILDSVSTPTIENLNIQEILHCFYRDEFNARLDRFISMFETFGLDQNEAQRATSIVGELGNNVFDHNLGNWPTRISGCIISAQHYPSLQKIYIAVGDPGVGFFGSLKTAFPEIGNDVDAIKKGLAGNTGRIDEVRGNGLKLIQQWTIENFSGCVMIHSGNGLVTVDKTGMKQYTVCRILGTVAQFVINYSYRE